VVGSFPCPDWQISSAEEGYGYTATLQHRFGANILCGKNQYIPVEIPMEPPGDLPKLLNKVQHMIKLQVIGNLGKDCVTNSVNGKSVINFSVAHTEKYKDASGMQKESTIWVECAYWTDRTAVAPYLKKGTQVYVEGAPELRTYTKGDGSFGASLSLRVLNVQLLGSGRSEQGGYAEQPATSNTGIPVPNDVPVEDDLPF
jgi:single-strand DNA-binding protein